MLTISSSLQYNRMNRYVAIHYKELGASKGNDEDIIKSDKNDFFLYLVKSIGMVRVSTVTITTK